MGRSPCCAKEGLNRGAWTVAEDKKLTDYIKIHGEGKWRNLPKKAGLKRCGKSCRLRWLNYLRPDIKRGNISHDEEELIIRLHKLLGNRWSLIAGRLPGRTDNEIKNYWNTNIGKKLQQQPRKPSYPCREKSKFAAEKLVAPPGKAGREPYPIRTKATKCTKVFITTPEPHKYDAHEDQVFQTKQIMVAASMAAHRCGDHQGVMKTSESPPEFNLEENNPSDFMIDFEVDEHFLSLLNGTELSALPNFDDAVGGDSSATTNTNSDETPLFSEDKQLREMDFPSIDLLIGSESEWFTD